MSPADLSIWFICLSPCTCFVLCSSHISHVYSIICSLRWNRMLKESMFESYWWPLIKNVQIKSNNHIGACKLYKKSIWNIWRCVMLMHTALWIWLECGRLMAWALIIMLMRRQDVHTDTSMTMFLELYISTSNMVWHTDNLSLGVKVELGSHNYLDAPP